MELMSTPVDEDRLVRLGRVGNRLNAAVADRAPNNLFTLRIFTFLGLNNVAGRLKLKVLMNHKKKHTYHLFEILMKNLNKLPFKHRLLTLLNSQNCLTVLQLG